jgi:hypothetical protein
MLNVKRISGEKLTVISDLKEKRLMYRCEVPEKVLRQDFDWCSDDDGFFNYRGTWYHLSNFMRTDSGGELSGAGWQGYHGDSFFSGIVIAVSSDTQGYVVGRYLS